MTKTRADAQKQAGSRKAAGRKPSRKLEITRQRIVAAAAKVFSRKGYQLALLSEIAAEAGIHVTALYYHFDSKERLVEEMLNHLALRVANRVQAEVEALGEQASYRERILAAAKAQMAAILSETDYMKAHGRVLYQVPEDVRLRHFKILRLGYAIWRSLIHEAWLRGEIRRDLEPGITTQLLMGSLNWSPEWYKPGRLSPAEIAERAVDIAFDGMAPRAPGGKRRTPAAKARRG
jgi:AcrR family transcriptional regulator